MAKLFGIPIDERDEEKEKDEAADVDNRHSSYEDRFIVDAKML
jgi:hypothetical protein